MTERMHATGGIDSRPVAGHEHHARRADGHERVARGDNACRHAAGSLVARARSHGQSGGQAEDCRRSGGQRAGRLGRLDHARQPLQRNIQVARHGLGPFAVGYVKEGSARGVGNVCGGLAGEAQANEVLGQQHAPDLGVGVGLVLAHPQQLGRGEAFQRRVGGARDDFGQPDLAFDGLALRPGALVAPENGRPDRLVALVEERRAVHLAGEPDSPDGRGVRRGPDACA